MTAGRPGFPPPEVVAVKRHDPARITPGDRARVRLAPGLLEWLCATPEGAERPPARGTHPMSGLPRGLAVEAAILAAGGRENGVDVLRACEAQFESTARRDEALTADAEIAETGRRRVEVRTEVTGEDGRPVLLARLVLVRVLATGRAAELGPLAARETPARGSAAGVAGRTPPAGIDAEVPDELGIGQTDMVRSAFGLDVPSDAALAQLRPILVARICEMIRSDFQGLLGVLYRMDVSEERATEVFGRKEPGLIAEGLADLVIERHLEKTRTRQMRKGEPGRS